MLTWTGASTAEGVLCCRLDSYVTEGKSSGKTAIARQAVGHASQDTANQSTRWQVVESKCRVTH